MDITRKQTSNYNEGRNGWKPDMIVCHITDGSYDGSVSWLCNPQAQASAHFVVSRSGQITQLVDIQDTAWCNGTSVTAGHAYYCGDSTLSTVRQRATNANYYTISIEHEGMYNQTHGELTSAQLAATIELIKYIRNEVSRIYGITIPADRQHIVGHCEISPKEKPTCPGERFPFNEIIKALNGTPISEGTDVNHKSTGSQIYDYNNYSPAIPHPVTATGIVNADLLNVRDNPSTSANVITTLPRGRQVDICGGQGEFWHIFFPDGSMAWTSNKYVTLDNPQKLTWYDTTGTVSIKKGQSYTVLIVASTTPDNVYTGNGSAFSVTAKGVQGNRAPSKHLGGRIGQNYLYTITATGNVDTEAGVFVKIKGTPIKMFAAKIV